jgi:hypothetical protein
VPIPNLTKAGLLPPGIHDCTIEEIEQRFGGPPRSRRRALLLELSAYVSTIETATLAESLIVAGSYVTSAAEPNDVDILLVLPALHEMSARLRPGHYNLIARARVQKHSSIDLFVAPAESERYRELTEFFQLVRDRRDLQKGILRVRL